MNDLEYFEQNGQGTALVSDDAGNWAVSTSGDQNVPMEPPQDISTTFFIEAHEWKPTIAEALKAFREENR